MTFTFKNFKDGEKIPKYVQKKLFNAKEGAGIFCIFTSEGKERCALLILSVNLQCLKGWYLYLRLVQSREFWPRIFFCLFFLLLCIHAYTRRDTADFSKLLPGNRVIFSTTPAAAKVSPQCQFSILETLL